MNPIKTIHPFNVSVLFDKTRREKLGGGRGGGGLPFFEGLRSFQMGWGKLLILLGGDLFEWRR